MQDYKLISFKKSDFQDQHGNYWCTAAFEGVSEPVKWVVKDPMKIKEYETYYGEIKDQTSKSGKPYLRFFKAQKQDQGTPKKEWQPRDDEAIRAQFAIKTAVDLLKNPEGTVEEPTIEHWAIVFYQMVNRVKEAGADKPQEQTSLSDQWKNRKPDNTAVDEVFPVKEEPINLDDIPF